MAIVMALHSNEVTELSGWDYMAQLSYGQNGDTWGPKEITTTTPDYDVNGEYMLWDANPSDGVDSGWLSAGLTYDENTGLGFDVDGAGITRQVVPSDGIDYIDIRTVAKNQAAMLWSNTVVFFYKDGVMTEQVLLGSFGSDTLYEPGVDEQLLRITPTNSDNDKVVVAGMVKLLVPEGNYAAEDEIFSQILIYA